jgi:hypothetical protein
MYVFVYAYVCMYVYMLMYVCIYVYVCVLSCQVQAISQWNTYVLNLLSQ